MENNKKKFSIPPFVMLGIIAIVAAVILAATNMVTAPVIKANKEAAQMAAFQAIIPEADKFEAIENKPDDVETLVVAKKGDEVIGYCATAKKAGYAGPVAVTLGTDANGIVTGCVIGDSDFVETSGLGASWKEEKYTSRLVGIDAVNGGSFDAKAGSTITSTAVRDAANVALRAIVKCGMGKEPMETIVTFGSGSSSGPAAAASYPENGVIKGTAAGFGGDVTVTITMENGKIAAIAVETPDETPGLGAKCSEEDFTAQFVGKTLPLSMGAGVDAIAGATITSKAVVTALNEGAVDGNTVTGKAEGFGGDVTVTATLDGNGAIETLTVETPDETPGLGAKCSEEAFTAQFVGKTLPVAMGATVDGISGATITSKAVVDAANAAVPADGAEAPAPAPAGDAAPEATEAPVVDGALSATAKGFAGDVTVTVTLDGDNKIETIVIDVPNETDGFGKRCATEEFTAQFIGKGLDESFDTLSGATVTSTAVLDALKTIAPAAAAPADGMTATAKGFAGDVTVTVTLNGDNKIETIVIDVPNETDGFGKRCATEEFTAQFIGKGLDESFDTLSGATVTSTAVLDALKSMTPAPAEETAPAADGDVLTATAKGFAGDVTVRLTLDEEGLIKTIEVDTPNETDGFGKRCATEEFTAQFIGKPLKAEFDALAGATITSKAVIGAVNDLAPQPREEAPEATEAPAEETAPAGDELTAKAEGFESDVKVALTLDADGKIASITVDASGETPGIGQRCSTEEFTAQFIGKAPYDKFDVLAGATFTSKAAIAAVNSLAPADIAAVDAAEATPAPEATE
ncbi:MAG: FMN-binding protein, partial [Clostridia bacterium]|nr:FMN-binding protein [Clostridia bacterium]